MGIFVGAIYGLLGIGLSLVFAGIRNLINLSHGHIAILAAYIALTLSIAMSLDPLVSAVIVLPVIFVLGFIIQFGLVNKTIFKDLTISLLILVGLTSVIENLMLLVWNPDPRSLARYAPYAIQSFNLFGASVPLIYLVGFSISIVATVMLYVFLKYTYSGKAMRAASEDPTYTECLGVNIRKIYAYTFGLALAVAAIAGILIGLMYVFVPSSGMSYTIIAFGVMVLGGLGSMRGALIGGIILGLTQQLAAHFLGVQYQFFLGYVIIILILTLRPEGLFGYRV